MFATTFTFSRSFYPNRLTTVHTRVHTLTPETITQGDSQLVVEQLWLGVLLRDTSTGVQTSNLPVISQPALPF
jgi:hypothetical protein